MSAQQSPTHSVELSREALAAAVAPVNALADDALLVLRGCEVTIEAHDAANVAGASARIHGAHTDAKREVGVCVTRLAGLCERIGSESVTLTHNADDEAVRINTDSMRYELPTLNDTAVLSGFNAPEVDHTFVGSIRPEWLRQAASLVSLAGGKVAMRYSNDGETLLFENRKADSEEQVKLEYGRDVLPSFERGGDAVSLFSRGYIEDIAAVLPDEATPRLSLGNEVPCELSYSAADGCVNVTVAQAPQIVERGRQ